MLDFGTIRQVNYSDLDKIVEIERKCFDVNTAYTRRQLRYLIKQASSRCLAEEKGEILRGFIIVLYRQGTGVAGIETLNVDPAFRGLEIGKRLLRAAEEDIYFLDVRRIKLEVSMGNLAAINLYEKSGFRKTAILKNYYNFEHHGTCDAFQMVKQLAT